ncbi:sugar transferase, partial [Paraclostridium benzoelyticum]|nr:sugar transferase [Paraclostridium benzoelyticum]
MQKFIKRAIDILGSFLGGLLISPSLIIIAILIKIKLGSPIFFTQDRVGKEGK